MTHSKGRGYLVPFNDDIQPRLAPGPSTTKEFHVPGVILSQRHYNFIPPALENAISLQKRRTRDDPRALSL